MPVKIAALIVAGGKGTRAALPGVPPKQYMMLGGRTILARTLGIFLEHPAIGVVRAVIAADDRAMYEGATKGLAGPLLAPVEGGGSRQSSVRNGLLALSQASPDIVLIHDAVRPFVEPQVLDRVIEAVEKGVGVVAGLPSIDTLKRVDETGRVCETVSRETLWRAQTPQAFWFGDILDAHNKAVAAGLDSFTDDAAVAEWAGLPIRMALGGQRNVKITTSDDITMARRLVEGKAGAMDLRTGTGFDVHRLVPGDHVWLCGVRIEHTSALEGHSDADVGLHALTDAILGAIGAGDIGLHFPPSDAKWKGASSNIFLEAAARMVGESGGRITNVDVTVLCEAPKIGPHRDRMRARIAEILGLDEGRVNVKATTTETLGFTGRREGIAAMASATVMMGNS